MQPMLQASASNQIESGSNFMDEGNTEKSSVTKGVTPQMQEVLSYNSDVGGNLSYKNIMSQVLSSTQTNGNNNNNNGLAGTQN